MTTLLAPDRQETWAPVWLITLGANRWASVDGLMVSGEVYSGRILGDINVERRFIDTFFGTVEQAIVEIALANADRALDAVYTTDLRGTALTITRYDIATATSVTEFTGAVNQVSLEPGRVVVRAVAPDVDTFEHDVPQGVVTAATFPNAVDVGAQIPVVLGNVERVPLPYVNDDTVNNFYDYLVGRGALTVTAVYRDTSNGTLSAAGVGEYTVETTRYAGLTSVRFTARQINFSGSFYPMRADVVGLAAERNFARAVRTLLNDSAWGLNQPVNAASFNAAEALIDPATGTSVTGLYCDGALVEPRQAQDVLRELLLVRGMGLSTNSAGEWTISVDTEQANVRLVAQDGTGDGERTLLGARTRTRRALADAVKLLRVRYRWDYTQGQFRLEQSRTVNAAFGRDLVVEHHFLRDSTAADKMTDYLGKREKLGDETLEVDLTQEARKLAVGELVTVTYAPLAISAVTYEARLVRKSLDRVTVELGLWDANFYVYAAGTLPADPTFPLLGETFRDAPAIPSGLALATSAILDADGASRVVLDLTWSANGEVDFSHYVVQFRQQGDPKFTERQVQKGTTTVREVGVVANVTYEAKIRAIDAFDNASAFSALVTLVTAKDTTAPADPTVTVVTQAGARVVEVEFTFAAPADWSYTELYRHTVNNSAASTMIQQNKVKRFHDENVTYGTTYYYWAKVVDQSGNKSGFSPSAGHSVTVAQVVTGDVTDNAVTESAASRIDGSLALTGSFQDLASVTVNVGNVVVYLSSAADLTGTGTVEARIYDGGTARVSGTAIAPVPISLSDVDVIAFDTFQADAFQADTFQTSSVGGATKTYALQARVTAGAASAQTRRIGALSRKK